MRDLQHPDNSRHEINDFFLAGTIATLGKPILSLYLILREDVLPVSNLLWSDHISGQIKMLRFKAPCTAGTKSVTVATPNLLQWIFGVAFPMHLPGSLRETSWCPQTCWP